MKQPTNGAQSLFHHLPTIVIKARCHDGFAQVSSLGDADRLAIALRSLTPNRRELFIANRVQDHADRGIFYARQGYAYVAQDCRGRYDSEGTFYAYTADAEKVPSGASAPQRPCVDLASAVSVFSHAWFDQCHSERSEESKEVEGLRDAIRTRPRP